MSPARLVPELYCADLARSLAFYRDLLGFGVRFERPEDGFAYLEREGAELMLEQLEQVARQDGPRGRTFLTAALDYPFGRGVNLQIQVEAIAPLHAAVIAAPWPLFLELEDRWYRQDERELGNRQFIVQDPDGYLLRFFEDLGSRAAPASANA